MKCGKALGSFVLVLTFLGLVSGCSDNGGYQVRHWFEKDERQISQAQADVKRVQNCRDDTQLWKMLNERTNHGLEMANKIRHLKVEIKGPAVDLVVMILGQDGIAITMNKITKEEMMANIKVIDFFVSCDNAKTNWYVNSNKIQSGSYSLVVKIIDPEKLVYKAQIELPIPDQLKDK